MESYTLKPIGDTTELTVDVDVVEKHEDHFQEKFPQALQELKRLSEEA
jgi:hypothetical protein